MQNTSFSGQPIFSQLLSMIPGRLIQKCTVKHNSDHYYKRFRSFDHLVTMLFCAFSGCKSLREVTTGLQVWEKRLKHLGLRFTPRRSTLSDANAKRSSEFFADMFQELHQYYYSSFPDSRSERALLKRMFLIDSTTIRLFQAIMANSGNPKANGKRKGGVKAHVMMNAEDDVPELVILTEAIRSDRPFLSVINRPKGSILVFDRGYFNFNAWRDLSENGVFWVTRAGDSLRIEVRQKRPIEALEQQAGISSDELVIIGERNKVEGRRIGFKDPQSGKTLVFLTNHYEFKPSQIAAIYKQRWQIEMLFKRLKQNYPLKYFLGDNPNAIKIQIWCSLICDLLIQALRKKGGGRNWSYSNLASIIRLHLATYVNLSKFLQNPEKSLQVAYSDTKNGGQRSLFPT